MRTRITQPNPTWKDQLVHIRKVLFAIARSERSKKSIWRFVEATLIDTIRKRNFDVGDDIVDEIVNEVKKLEEIESQENHG